MFSMKVFTGRAHTALAKKICEYLGLPLGRAILSNFPDGEISCKIDEDVRGRDVYIIQPTCPPVNDNLMELLVMIDSFKRASAERITAVIPYYGYARQDRKDEGRVPITAKLVANLITRAGADRVLAMDLHTAQIQGFFDIPMDHLYAAPVLDDFIKAQGLCDDDFVVVSPDGGSIKRSLAHMARLGGSLAIIDKRRSSAEKTKQAHVIGSPVEGQTVFIFDDMISTGGSVCGAAEAMRANGAKKIYLAATHGVFCGNALERFANTPFDGLFVTDTIPIPPDRQPEKMTVISVAPLLGEAIKRIHRNESVSRLFV